MYVLLNLLRRESIKETHAVQQWNAVFFVAGFLRSVSREYNPLANFVERFVFVEKVKTKRQGMPFVHVICGDLYLENVEKFSSANSKKDRLRNACCFVRIVETMTYSLCEIVVLGNVCCQQEQWRRLENFRFKQQCFDMNACAMNGNRKDDACVLKKEVVFVTERHAKGLILIAVLIVVTLLPENANADQILFEFVSASQMRSGKETQSA